MYLENLWMFSDAQAVTATAVSTNVVDTGVAERNIGNGEPVNLLVLCTTTATAGGAATMVATLQDSADNSSFADVLSSVAVPVASLVAGYEFKFGALPPSLRRYLRLNYTIATGPLTAGNFTASIVADRQSNVARASGFTIGA